MNDTRRRQRLAVFLDGTWNRSDDCTNVRHLYNLSRDGLDEDGVYQHRYYDEGVGTGVLDGVTGGGFGLGLEDKVRAAYNWLVEHYEDGDEIFIFGFSRGAYTARSLVGFIAACGIMKRGAPLTVTQLWQGYGILGRDREHRTNWWERLVGKRSAPFRSLNQLKWDPWHGGGEISEPKNLTESLLVTWSRRAKIHYLGIFDTVGAMGWDALAIPGLRSKLALHHNMRPTTLVQNCRHALAVDEHRSSFRPTPIKQYLINDWDEDTAAKKTAKWDGTIQRWFVGAHSNVGGGYSNNLLAARPLEWILNGAEEAGLDADPLPAAQGAAASQRSDSYADFAKPIWAHIVRAKRLHRPIDPPADVRAKSASGRKGYALRPISESVDPSVFQLAKDDPDYTPPNVVQLARRRLDEGDTSADMKWMAERKPQHAWLADTLSGRATLLGWCILAALGMGVLHLVFFGQFPEFDEFMRRYLATAAILVWIDWAESYGSAAVALRPDGPARRAYYESAFWVRFFSQAALATGAVAFLVHCWHDGWTAETLIGLYEELAEDTLSWWPLAASAVGAALLLDIVRKRSPLPGIGAAALTATCFAVAAAAVSGVAFWLGPTGPIQEPATPISEHPSDALRLAGGLLLLQVGLITLLRGLHWAGLALARANLPSIMKLQFAFTPGRIKKLFEDCAEGLTRNWIPAKERRATATSEVEFIMRSALWRDLVGLIPLYTLVLGCGLWLGASFLDHAWLSWLAGDAFGTGIKNWAALIVVTALFDVIENVSHINHVKRWAEEKAPSALSLALGCLATLIKTLGFAAAALITVFLVLPLATFEVILEIDGGWRRILAGSVSMVMAVIAAGTAAAYVKTTLRRLRGGESSTPD